MVEPSLFDIYLCDNCEAELYSFDAYQVSLSFAKVLQQQQQIDNKVIVKTNTIFFSNYFRSMKRHVKVIMRRSNRTMMMSYSVVKKNQLESQKNRFKIVFCNIFNCVKIHRTRIGSHLNQRHRTNERAKLRWHRVATITTPFIQIKIITVKQGKVQKFDEWHEGRLV